MAELEDAYAHAWEEWERTAEATEWDATAGDGIADTHEGDAFANG